MISLLNPIVTATVKIFDILIFTYRLHVQMLPAKGERDRVMELVVLWPRPVSQGSSSLTIQSSNSLSSGFVP